MEPLEAGMKNTLAYQTKVLVTRKSILQHSSSKTCLFMNKEEQIKNCQFLFKKKFFF